MKMIKLKKLLKESITWNNRKFGERLPTIEDYKEEYNKKNGIVEDLLSEKKMFDEKNIRKAMKMKPIDARIFISKIIGDKSLMKAFEGLKAIETHLNYSIKKDSVINRLDLNLKDQLRHKYANAEEVKGNIKLFGM